MVTRKKLRVEIHQRANEWLVFVDGRPIGEIIRGWFTQKTTKRHIFRELNSKGIEYDVYQRLRLFENGKVLGWRLIFKDTKEILAIPLERIPEVGILNPPHSAGNQYHVKMQYFNVEQPALQKELFQ
jgi:hypothetical protein